MMSNSLIGNQIDDSDYYYVYERCFPVFFQQDVEKQGLHHHDCRQLGFWSGCLFWSPENEYSNSTSDGEIIREKLMNLSKTDKIPGSCLIQVWIAIEIDGKCLLKTQNQPFIISTKEEKATISEQLCIYRMKISEDVGFQNVGVVDRVFRNQRMECTPDIKYYSSKEYFQQDLASSCGIKGYVAIPLSSSLGVIEIVSIQQMDEHFWHKDLPKFVAYLQENSLMKAPSCKGLCSQEHHKYASLGYAVSEINEVLDVINKSGDILLAQTWILCKKCNSLSTIERVDHKFVTSHKCNKKISIPQSLCTHQIGKGVIASAAWFNNLVYCENVADFSITEYPWAHFARHCDLSSCFAICLRSNHTGDLVYVLELFLSPSNLKKHGGGIATLVPLLAQMRQNFRTFEVASGEKIGENLSVQVIDAKIPHELEFFEIGKLGSIKHSFNKNDYIDKGKGVSITEVTDVSTASLKQRKDIIELDSGGSTSEEGIIGSSQTRRGNGEISISLADIQKQYGKRIEAAAAALGIHKSTLKRKCRDYKIFRWPSTRRKSHVIVDAKYGDNQLMEFDPSESSGYNQLHKQVKMRLKKEENSLIDPIYEGCGQEISTTEVSDFSSSSNECTIDSLQTRRENGKVPIPLKEIEKRYGTKRKDAAEALGVSVSTLKRICREYNIFRWPSMSRKRLVTIKAKYGANEFLEFEHSESSGYDELHKQVVTRLKREVRVYYKNNHNQMILVACDDDLQRHISSSKPRCTTLELIIQ